MCAHFDERAGCILGQSHIICNGSHKDVFVNKLCVLLNGYIAYNKGQV